MQLTTYLMFDGNCEAAFRFYEKCLGGKIAVMMRYADSPMASDVPPEARQKIIHTTLSIGNQQLAGADTMPGHYKLPQGFSVTLNLGSVSDAEKIFLDLSEKGQVQMPIQKTFWAARFGMLVDQFGTPWMINCASQSVRGDNIGSQAAAIFFVIILTKVPNRSAMPATIQRHIAHLRNLEQQGQLVLCGPFTDHDSGMVVVRARSKADAVSIAMADPFVIEGVRTSEVRTWELATAENNYLGAPVTTLKA